MTTPLDDISFLARSENRVRVLETLSVEPHTREELREATGISKVTIKRVLEAFTERGWVVMERGEHRTTELGKLIAADFATLTATVEATQRLQGVIRWLPTEDLEFDLRHLADAQVFGPGQYNPVAQLDRWVELIRSAETIHLVTHALSSVTLEAIRTEVVEHGQEFEGVFESGLVERMLTEESVRGWSREILQSGRGSLFRHDDTGPCIFANFDDLVGMLVMDEEGATRVHIESEDDTVHEWAERTFETHRADATPLTADDFAG